MQTHTHTDMCEHRYTYTNILRDVPPHPVSLNLSNMIDLPHVLHSVFCILVLTKYTITTNWFIY